ncbi:MAG: anthranilate/aminodeoxychorismate synthase component II, partial [Gemmatimonadetes bacterium]|nr:anthranilate/aminodeoxychorismate synthase component II [Gemmatimonadota bacterium]NIQ57438.1 anthranilate/aminodeoxychorismate synthase component II [Gemmatimonadota bacterium]NIU79121.1 anthranilate/aminodeoxychorismate synthase component II [Gammaproteobacteria bacterium]NIX46789.1 anthranilate/aminodeoxychorismate synthase component II [Gemmatimonadota bacterium]NIY11143.1 anthranilate/aminodeoxychorismate synthase component II [Gemmatimonadota bacterium]
MTVDEILELAPAGIVLSPGPCTPAEAGISVEAVRRLGPERPILGVCLGHQAIGEAYGARVVRARRLM